jgi:hypothetical protein
MVLPVVGLWYDFGFSLPEVLARSAFHQKLLSINGRLTIAQLARLDSPLMFGKPGKHQDCSSKAGTPELCFRLHRFEAKKMEHERGYHPRASTAAWEETMDPDDRREGGAICHLGCEALLQCMEEMPRQS